MQSLPTISFVIATYNSQRTIEKCLKSIREQQYPQDKLEIIVVDGGSKDHTKQFAKKYKIRWYDIPPDIQNAEYNKSIGVSKATGEILFLLDHDNILPHKNCLRRLVQPFLDNNDVVGVETLRYHYDPASSLLDRYFALFGAGDPLAWYLGKADRLSYMYDTYNLMGKAVNKGDYYLVRFTPDQIPTLGANGFLIRRAILMKNAKVDPVNFFHIDINVDLIQKGFSLYAFVKDSILHLTGYGSLTHFLIRRMIFLEQYHLGNQSIAAKSVRRYSVFEKKDTMKLIRFIFLSITFVVPIYDSMKGFRKIPDPAWFLHPILCFSLVILYGWIIMKHQFELLLKILFRSKTDLFTAK